LSTIAKIFKQTAPLAAAFFIVKAPCSAPLAAELDFIGVAMIKREEFSNF